MRRLTSLLSCCLLIVLLGACQEEDNAFDAPSFPGNFEKPIDIPKFNPEFPDSPLETTGQSIPLNDHVSFHLPRFPRPKPCPVLAGCNLPNPAFILSVVKGGSIRAADLELYADNGQLYASSSKEFGGSTVYGKGSALVSLGVIDDQVSSKNLSLRVRIAYEVGGKRYSEEIFKESVPVHSTKYEEAGSVMFRFPRFPRPKPCPVLAGCSIPNPELHTIVPKGRILEMTAQLYTENEELYACAGKECGSIIEYEDEEALATFTVVNPEIEAENLILALQITYEVEGKVISEKIYSENVPLSME
ncbi:MAG: hypothetical protein WBA23_23395 [Tunicatimonas sp.]|uniref:hypothetical protein n=1 Tax=Tunicatimonas sp. TaxID=1940096 RepID=UPI003C71B635